MPRLTGRFGKLTVGGTPIGDLFDWTCEFEAEFEVAPIKGEKFNTGAFGGLDTRITAQRFVQDTTGIDLAALVVTPFASDPPGAEVAYVLEQIDGAGAAATSISGNGVVRRGSTNSPRSLINDEFEIHGTSIPVIA